MTDAPVFQYKRLKQCHPRVDLGSLRCLHALYRGGRHLLKDDVVMTEVFPRHLHEKPSTYDERRRRAFYENLFALVINQISAGLAQDPIRLAALNEDEAGTRDAYWTALLENAAPPGPESEQRPLDQVVRAWAVEALVCGWAWLQCDMPPPDTVSKSLGEQEAAGSLRAYPCLWPTDCVVDWSEQNGHLQWVRTYECKIPDDDPTKPRTTEVRCWTLWTADKWYRYEVTIDTSPQSQRREPQPDEFIPPVDQGDHSFGVVPWLKFDLCRNGDTYLHVGDMLESLCKNYFNRSNGESFQWIATYYQQLYEFLGQEMPGIDTPVPENQTNPNRAHAVRGPNIVQVRGKDDDARYVAPDMTGAEVGHKSLQQQRDAIMRSTGHMALSQDTSGAMLRRSADSKKQDSIAQEILLGAIGKRLLAAAQHVMVMLAAGRRKSEEAPQLQGYEHFSIQDVDNMIQQVVELEPVGIKSATALVEMQWRLLRTLLGDDTPEEVMTRVRKELEMAITQEQLMAPPPPAPPKYGEEPPPPPEKEPA